MSFIRDFFLAVRHNDAAALEALIAHGADVNGRNRSGETALAYAASLGNEAAVRVLLEHGAAEREPLPMIEAAVGDSPGIMRLFLARGGDVNTCDERGWTALHEAADWGDIQVARILLEHGADVRAGPPNLPTPLEHARTQRHADVVALLEAAEQKQKDAS